ncbi:MAG: hypothetical protein P3B98_03610, partial [Gemmatimonadota bacterium]|nr:hypothetical protein [Gemmatimonadota bacterium]
MGVLRTALAFGTLTLSVPVLAQDSRYGFDRSRVERGREKGGRSGDTRGEGRPEGRGESRGENRGTPRVEPRGEPRATPRADDRDGRNNRGLGRNEPRGGVSENRYDPRDRREDRGIVVRPPVGVDRDGRRDGRWDGRYDGRNDGRYDARTDVRYGSRPDPRYAPYGYRAPYRYGDRDFRHRDLVRIGVWFRALPSVRLAGYGYYDRGYGGIRYVFRPGLSLSMSVFAQLHLLPIEL